MNNKKLFTLLGGICLGLMVAFISPNDVAGAQPTNKDSKTLLVDGGVNPPFSIGGKALLYFGDELAKRTNGLIKCKYVWSGAVSAPGEEIGNVVGRVVDMAWIPLMFYPTELYLNDGLHVLPFKIPDRRVMQEVYLELCEQKPVLTKEFEKLGVQLLYHQIDAAMDLQSLTPITKLEDLKDQKIAIAGGWPQRIVSAVGVTPVPVVLAERPVALQTKMIDGTICPLTVAFPFKFHQWAKNATFMRWGVDAGAVAVINLELFNRFPKDIQKTILEVGRDSGRKFVEMDLAFEAKAKEVFAAAGVTSYTFSDEDVRKWAELISDLPAQWVKQGEARGLPARDVMDTYLRLQREKGHKFPVQWKLGD